MGSPLPGGSREVLTAASTVAGLVLLVVLAREVFHQLLQPEGRGSVSVWILRAGRWLARRIGLRAMRVAGPLSLVAVLFCWFALAVIGWTLILAPHLPEGFARSDDVPTQPAVLDAAYLSSVTIATLGAPDLVPQTPMMRVLIPLESVMGFGLLTASLTWLLSLYPPIARQRSVARQVHRVLERERIEGRHLQPLAGQVSDLTTDLNMSIAIYFFHPADERECLAETMVPLWDLATRTVASTEDPMIRDDADSLLGALTQLAQVLAEDHLPWMAGATPRNILHAWLLDDQPRAGASTRALDRERTLTRS